MNTKKSKSLVTQIFGVSALAALAIVAGFIVAFWGCNSYSNQYPSAPVPAPKTIPANTVVIAGYGFSPSTLTVTRNTTVAWQNTDGVAHTSTSDNGVWDTGDIATGATKTATFTTAGTFTYHCSRHPMMTATIVVQ